MTARVLNSLTAEDYAREALERTMNSVVPSTSVILSSMVDEGDVVIILTRMSAFYCG